MIELTETQLQALQCEPKPHLVNPRTKETFVLVPLREYDLLTEAKHALKGTVLHYERPTDPVAETDWSAAGTTKRVPGLHAGAIQTTEDFDAPLPDEFWAGIS